MDELKSQGLIAHIARDYKRRDQLFGEFDSIALAILHGRDIPTLTPGAKHGCRFRRVLAA